MGLSRRIRGGTRRRRRFLVRACQGALILALGACGAVEPRPAAEPRLDAAARGGDGVAAADVPHSTFSRNANLTAGLMGSMLKTYATDPFVRPVSTAKSLGSLVSNTIVDATRRVYINAVRLPAIRSTPIPPLADGPGMDLEAWERELDQITGTKSSTGELEFLVDGDGFFPDFIDEMEAAKMSIQLRTYIFDNDDYAVRIADLLKARSQEVDVTVLMDGIGTVTGAHVLSESLPNTHVPPGAMDAYLQTGSRVKARALTNPWFTGDHCKVAIIDRKVAFLGGMNIGREYRYDWHDLMVRIEGPVVERLARDADDAWAQSGFWGEWNGLFTESRPADEPRAGDGYPIRLLHTQAPDSQIYRAKIAAIRRAQKYIYIENPYFSDDVILYELIEARRRGVDVRFVISAGGDHLLMDLSNTKVLNELLANGVRVFVYPKMTHAKAAIIDGWLTVGTANLDALSLRINKEVNVATSHPAAVEALKREFFEPDFAVSTELTQPLPEQITNWLAEAFADVFM